MTVINRTITKNAEHKGLYQKAILIPINLEI